MIRTLTRTVTRNSTTQRDVTLTGSSFMFTTNHEEPH